MKRKILILAVSTMLLLTACTRAGVGEQKQVSKSMALTAYTGAGAGEQKQVSKTPNFAGAYEEMNAPEFWIGRIKNPNEIIMTASQIAEFNKNVPNTKETNCVDLNGYKRSFSKAEMLKQLQKYSIPKETRYIGKTPLKKAYYEALILNRNEASVAEQNPIRLGVIIQNTELRTWPTTDVSYNLINDIEFDLNCETVLKTCERVAVLHESADKQWLYVQAYNYIGWVKAENIAFCTENEWEKIGKNANWLTVTGNRVLLDFSNINSKVSRRELTMGTRLILLEDKPAVIDGISTINSHVVLLPVRKENGTLELAATRVPQSLDVTAGFLDYTPENVIRQSFKMLGERYGWSSLWDARDCASYIMDIYQCFGIKLPRNSKNQAMVSGERVDVSGYGDAKKQALILRQPVGTMLELKGHIIMYLGEYQGKPYVIHQSYEFIPKGKTGVATAACVLVSDLEIKRSNNGNTFLREIRTVDAVIK